MQTTALGDRVITVFAERVDGSLTEHITLAMPEPELVIREDDGRRGEVFSLADYFYRSLRTVR